MLNVYMVLRAAAALLGAALSLFNINGWLPVMLGPDCWNYSTVELEAQQAARSVDRVGYHIGVDAATLDTPLAQSLRYAVSGVGVHLAFIGGVVLILGLSTPRASRLHFFVPLSMLVLDALTLLNATGSIDKNTAGHPRCFTSSIGECAAALSTFAPVVALDGLACLASITGIYPRPDAKAQNE